MDYRLRKTSSNKSPTPGDDEKETREFLSDDSSNEGVEKKQRRSGCVLACAGIMFSLSIIVLVISLSCSARILEMRGVIAVGGLERVLRKGDRQLVREAVSYKLNAFVEKLRLDGEVHVPSRIFGNATVYRDLMTPPEVGFEYDADGNKCSTKCECSRAGLASYGRFCGLGYTGCPGYPPCDELDACCSAHDACVTVKGRLDCGCTLALYECAMCAASTHVSSDLWRCSEMANAAANVVADMAFIFPDCINSISNRQDRTCIDTTHKGICNGKDTIPFIRWGERRQQNA